ncbi:MAG: RluA family pseudouridine synthase [Kiritimatiellia bacterium]
MDLSLAKGEEPCFERICRISLPPGSLSDTALLELVSARFTYRSLDEWAQALAEKQLERCGDALLFHPPLLPEPEVDWDCRMLHEDEEVLVIDKSGNLPCHPAGRFFNHTLWALLKHKGLEAPQFVNRLDRETSGIVLVAKTAQACKELRREFAAQRVEKHYQAAVEGTLHSAQTARGTLAQAHTPIRKKQEFRFDSNGSVITEFTPLAHRNMPELTLLDIHPIGGKLHQIRATLLACGFPLVGDKLYGVDETIYLRFAKGQLTPTDTLRLRIKRQALHAATLTLRRHSETCRYEAPLPSDIAGLFQAHD